MELNDIIVLQTGDYGEVISNRCLLSSSRIEAIILNKGTDPMKLLRLELRNESEKGALLDSILLDKLLPPCSCEEVKRTYTHTFYLKTSIIPYFVLVFEYKGEQYKIGKDWDISEFEKL